MSDIETTIEQEKADFIAAFDLETATEEERHEFGRTLANYDKVLDRIRENLDR